MKCLLFVALGAQTTGTVLAVILNAFLIFIILRHTKNNFGFYKYILAIFSMFESLYAIVVFIGMPIHFISERTWIGFNYYGPIGGTSFAHLGPLTYCFFYESWLGLVVINFLFRYICVCRPISADYVSRHKLPKVVAWASALLYFSICGCCAYFFCPSNTASPNMLLQIHDLFGLSNESIVAYYVMRFTNIDGSFSPVSAAAILTHYAMICTSVTIVSFCSFQLWRTIRNVQNVKINISLERQLFKSLIIQTAIPVVLCHVPSVFAMSFPLWETELDFWPFFSVFTTVPKAIDPIISILCIKDYKAAVGTMFGFQRATTSVVPSSQYQIRYARTH